MDIWIIWLIIAGVLLIIELATLWITTLCFAAGSLGAMIVALCGGSFTLQLLVLALAALCTFYLFGGKVAEMQQRRAERRALNTNVDALIGRECLVTQPISEFKQGYIKVDGDNWPAVSPDSASIPAGTRVKIVAHDSIVMTVVPV